MSPNYYYLVSSLPVLDFETGSPSDFEDFLRECEKLLPRKDASLIARLRRDDISADLELMAHPVIHAVGEFERAVRNEGVFARAARWGVDPVRHARGERTTDAAVRDLVQQALKEEDLIKAERLMDKARWRMLEDFEMGHYFDLQHVLIYGLKLKILNRWKKFHSPVGREIWQEMRKIEMPSRLV